MSRPKNYYIFGQGISQSLSPPIHNAGFKHYGLPHHYDIHECPDLDTVRSIIEDSTFGGSSITMPHKLRASKFCTSISDSASTIGAINTLAVSEGPTGDGASQRSIHGDNTDWSGLYSLVAEYMAQSKPDTSVGLVIGAGGAARAAVYALIQARVEKIYIANRTLANAAKVAQDFQGLHPVIPVVFPSGLAEDPDFIVGTVPGEAFTAESYAELFRKKQGLCIEMAYKPRITKLLEVAMEHEKWTTADGLEVLLRQAFEQFRIWTGREPPETVMRQAVADEFERRTRSDGMARTSL
ncbi:hypothetical protein BDV59DRAFT_207620 [Aspergillus ambiguus]|uniref:uncharacterized protein n=1 Tax=Aspergillus ambiguus TaxID=176160 RepID=UPI003CCCD419